MKVMKEKSDKKWWKVIKVMEEKSDKKWWNMFSAELRWHLGNPEYVLQVYKTARPLVEPNFLNNSRWSSRWDVILRYPHDGWPYSPRVDRRKIRKFWFIMISKKYFFNGKYRSYAARFRNLLVHVITMNKHEKYSLSNHFGQGRIFDEDIKIQQFSTIWSSYQAPQLT